MRRGFGIIVSLVMIVGGLSGTLALRGTGSSTALVIVGVVLLIINIIGIAKDNPGEEDGQTSDVIMPRTPDIVDPNSGFMFSGLLEKISSCYQQDLGDNSPMINVGYTGITYVQIIDAPDHEEGEKHNVVLYFQTMSDNKAIIERFKSCYYKDDFDFRESIVYHFFCGDDFEKAAKVISYILATVYCIPIKARLEFEIETE